MRPLLALLSVVVLSCGPEAAVEPSHARAGVTQQPPNSAPVDCRAMCIHATPQLIRDFFVPADLIDCDQRQWWAAKDCAACIETFRINYAVVPISCPP